ncbi:hypothetical protein [Haloquadratum walsbyi]|nr:hypothetical protein [Haloquadratum walsbyi]
MTGRTGTAGSVKRLALLFFVMSGLPELLVPRGVLQASTDSGLLL